MIVLISAVEQMERVKTGGVIARVAAIILRIGAVGESISRSMKSAVSFAGNCDLSISPPLAKVERPDQAIVRAMLGNGPNHVRVSTFARHYSVILRALNCSSLLHQHPRSCR